MVAIYSTFWDSNDVIYFSWGSIINEGMAIRVNSMFIVCVGPVFVKEDVRFHIICSLQYSININTVQVDPPPRITA